MSKKNVSKSNSKKEIKQLVEKSLESLLVKIDPGMGEKKFRKRIKRAGKVLISGIKVRGNNDEKTEKAEEVVAAV